MYNNYKRIAHSEIQDVEISKYLTKVINDKVRGKIPIGLIGYDHQSMNLDMLVDIELKTNFIELITKDIFYNIDSQ